MQWSGARLRISLFAPATWAEKPRRKKLMSCLFPWVSVFTADSHYILPLLVSSSLLAPATGQPIRLDSEQLLL